MEVARFVKKMAGNRKLILVFITTLILEIIFVLTVNGKIALANDHIGEMNLSSYLAGLDWRPILAKCSYYGWGMQWVFSILFKMTDNPFVIWYGYWIGAFIFASFVAVIVYKIEIECFNLADDVVSFIVAVAFGLLQYVDYAKACALDLGIWFSAYLLLKCVYVLKEDTPSKTYLFWGGICAIVVAWVRNCHELGVVLWIPFFCLLISKLFKRNWKFIAISTILFGVVYFFSNKIKDFDIAWLTTFREEEILVNTSVSQDLSFWFLESPQKFKTLLILIASNICALDIWTYGFLSVGIVIVISTLNNCVKTKKRLDSDVMVILFSGICACVVACGVAVLWGKGLASEVYSPGFSGKAYNHVDYYRFFGYPAVLGCIAYVRKNEFQDNTRKLILILALFRILYLIKYLFPIYSGERHYIAWQYTYVIKLSKQGSNLENIIIWSLVEILILYFIFHKNPVIKKSAIVLLTVIIAFTGIQFNKSWLHWADGKDNHFALPNASLQYCGGAYGLINYINQESVLRDKIMYLEGDSSDDYYYATTLQFVLNRYTIQTDVDKIDEMSLLFGADFDEFEQLGEEWMVYALGENEYVATKDVNMMIDIQNYIHSN